jgi:multiple sugar transport system substrate-binding protein
MAEPINFPTQEPPADPSSIGPTGAVQLPQTPPPTPVTPPPLAPAPPEASPRGRGLGKVLLIVIAVLLFVGLGFLAFRVLLKGRTPTLENKIVWWGLWEEASIINPLIEEYQAQHSGIKVEYVKQSHQDYRERLASALAEGKGPDIFTFHNSWVPMFKEELDKVPASIISPAEYAQIYYPVISSDLTSGTGFVGIPLMYDGLTLYINEEIFEAAGKPPPITWDDVRDLAKELTIKNEEGVITQAGIALGRTENVDHWPEIVALMMLQNGANLAEPTGELAAKAIDFFTIFYLEDKVWDETLPPSTVAFAAGKVAMYFGTSWRAFEIKQQNPALRFKTVPLPRLPKETPAETDIAYASYWAQGVWARSGNKDASWDFLKFISSKQSLEKMYQGASQLRLFGQPYPRVEMAELLSTHPILGSIITQAPDAQSWYLADRTFDGPTGINSQIKKYFEDAINAVNEKKDTEKSLETAAQGVAEVLARYGIGRQ